MIVLDASVLIAHLDRSDASHDRAGSLLEDVAAEPFGASPITLAEVLVGPTRTGRLQPTMAALRTLGVAPVDLADDASVRLADLRVATGLKLPGCCVLLAAETASADIATFDERLARAAQAVGIDVHA